MKNREIKFRAWANKAKSMFYAEGDALIQFKDGKLITACPNLELNWCKEENGDVLMQYIGVVDRNEKEIYEGDIVKSIGAEEDEIFEIKFEINGYYAGYWLGEDNEEIEVIGNKYENPELLELVN